MISPLVIDILIGLLLLYFMYDGYRRGFIVLLAEVVVVVVSLWLAGVFTTPFAQFLGIHFGVPKLLEKPVGFFVLWLLLQTILNVALGYAYRYTPNWLRDSLLNRLAGVIPSFLKGLISAAIILTLLAILPIRNDIRSAINASTLGHPLVETTQQIEQQLARRYNSELSDTMTFLTNTPFFPKQEGGSDESTESIALHFTTTQVSVDPKSEQTMLSLVNNERRKIGLAPLISDPALQTVARAHAKDMFARGYFSHNTPDGKDPFQRMEDAGITFTTAGENLALAPTVDVAHTGLMNSPKHRDNILYPEFGHVGIGVIDGGIYGEMFVQEFTN